MVDSSASVTQNHGKVDQSVAIFAWSIPFFPTPGLGSPDIGRREAGRSKARCTKSHRYYGERCFPNVPVVSPFLGGRVHAHRRVTQLERLPTPLLMPLP